MHVERLVGADLDERRMRAARAAATPGGSVTPVEPVERLGDTREKLAFRRSADRMSISSSMLVAVVCVTSAFGSYVRAPDRLQIERVLQRPARLRRPMLRDDERVHAAHDRIEHARIAERLVAHAAGSRCSPPPRRR